MINLRISPMRVYLFLFFNCIYAFLNFWIAFTLSTWIIPFAVGGIIFLLIALSMQKTIYYSIGRQKEDSSASFSWFWLIPILFCIVYFIGVYFLQQAAINMGVSKLWFSGVDWGITILSLLFSLYISFVHRGDRKG